MCNCKRLCAKKVVCRLSTLLMTMPINTIIWKQQRRASKHISTNQATCACVFVRPAQTEDCASRRTNERVFIICELLPSNFSILGNLWRAPNRRQMEVSPLPRKVEITGGGWQKKGSNIFVLSLKIFWCFFRTI